MQKITDTTGHPLTVTSVSQGYLVECAGLGTSVDQAARAQEMIAGTPFSVLYRSATAAPKVMRQTRFIRLAV